MKKRIWLPLVSASVVAMFCITIAFIEMADPEWTCSCGRNDWHYVGRDGVEESESHLVATGHMTSCKRVDQAARFMDRVYGFIFSGHEI